MIEYRVELANKVVRGRAVGNLYGVAEMVDGRRRGWLLPPQESEELARAMAERSNASCLTP